MNAKRALSSLLFLGVLAACQPAKPPAPAAAPQTYEVKGEVMRLPAAGSREILIRHEAIPDFRSEAGKVVGMDAMTMPFTLAEGVALDGIAVGDPISFTLETRWELDRDPVRVIRIAKDDAIYKMDLEKGALPESGNVTPQ